MTRVIAATRFFAKVEFTETCWSWKSAKNTGGYGLFYYDKNKRVVAHRWAYEFCVGSISEGLTLDHLCRIRHCVNPDHLEPVTLAENILRGEGVTATHARKTNCPSGHPYSKENTYIYRKRRYCRTCNRCRKVTSF